MLSRSLALGILTTACCLLLTRQLVAQSDDLPTTPILRINTEMHTAMINRIAVDAAETILATGSYDKTVKLWDLRREGGTAGELLRTIRLPSDAGGDVGKVYAVALHPGGRIVAAGGWCGSATYWKEKQGIYLYDTATGALLQRIGGLPNVISHLAFSPDGRFLAACLGSGNGVRVFQVEGDFSPPATDQRLEAAATEVFADAEYGGGKDSYWADWAPPQSAGLADGRSRFATVCYDGRVRLYEFAAADLGGAASSPRKALTPVATVETASHGGREPFSCAFHPDGRSLAVGYSDSTAVDVFSLSAPESGSRAAAAPPQLRYAFAADTAGLDNGSLSSVAWSRDGTRLLAGGVYDDGRFIDLGGNSPVIEWEEAGRGRRRAWPGTPNTIMQLTALRDGRTLLGAGDPAWKLDRFAEGDASVTGRVERWAELGDFRDAGDEFRVAADGGLVRFGFELWGKTPAMFSLADLRFVAPDDATALAAPKTSAPSLAILNWKNSTAPTLNGQPLALDPYETSFSVAIAPDGGRFLLGTSWTVRCFDPKGAELWKQPVPGVAWAVNISGDGRLAVAAFGDGTIRWYRLSDGEPLLAFFPHYRRESGVGNRESGIGEGDWVVWAPDTGHFRCSPDGAKLIGWQVNRGKEANPDFYSGEQLYQLLEDKHGILQRVLKEARPAREIVADLVARGEMSAPIPLAEALRGVPEISLAGLTDLATAPVEWASVTATARPTAQDIGISGIDLFANGKPMRPSGELRRAPDGTATQLFQVRLLRGKNEVTAVAYNQRGAASYPARTRQNYDGPKATSDLWVFGVGLEKYSNPAYNLAWCLNDVKASGEAIGSRGEGIFDEEHFELLPDAEATRPGIEAKFKELSAKVKPEDTFVFVYAGHGALSEEGRFHLVPYDVTRVVNEDQLRDKAIPADVLQRLLSDIPAQKQLMLLDACHSGAVTAQFRGAAEEVAIAQLSRATGVAILASSSADQFSRGDDDLEHGYFTWTFLEGLRDGKADGNKDGKVTVKELDAWVNDRLPQLTVERGKPPQYPQGYYKGADFPLGTVR